jgi:REP element-mobilizing transposase RayT
MPDQLRLRLKSTWGGRRSGAGRPRLARRTSVAHRARPTHKARHPVHLTLRARAGLPTLRRPSLFRVVRECIGRSSNAHFRILQFSVQKDHLHLLVEASDALALSSGAQGLAIRIARQLNRSLGRSGKLWKERCHTRALTSPREVRNALVYVLMNIRKHNPVACDGVDPCSSALWFDGWAPVRGLVLSSHPPPVQPARTWLASRGWRKRGLIHPRESPSHDC